MSPGIILLASLIGLLLAMFGAGGGMLTVPLLAYGMGLPLKSAIAASLWVVAFASLITLLLKQAWGSLNVKLLIFFATGGAAGSWLGAHVGLAIPEQIQGMIFSLLIWFVAWWMHRPKSREASSPEGRCRCGLAILTGFSLGIVTGVLGVGGGFLMVPALIWLGISDFKAAVSHSLVLIAVNAVIAGTTYLGHVELVWAPMMWIAGLASIGCLLGCKLAAYLPAARLQAMFTMLLILVGSLMMYETIAKMI